MITKFFSFLSYRFSNENSLSDITWAMCRTCESFKITFLNFFFPTIKFNNISEFEREYATEYSRPDFYVINDGIKYIIENKINDHNQHFGQYDKAFGILPERFGWIANYRPDDELKNAGYKVHTWEEFYDYLLDKIPEGTDENRLWKGYLEYVKNVCVIIKITKAMDLNGMYSLYEFNIVLNKILNAETDLYKLELYNSNRDTHHGGNILGTPKDGIMGKYFDLKYKRNTIKETWGWIGVYFERENPLICICFENNEWWGKPIVDIIQESKIKDLQQNDYYDKPYYEEGHLWFDLSKSKLAEFQNADLDGQINILSCFVKEVILLPTKDL